MFMRFEYSCSLFLFTLRVMLVLYMECDKHEQEKSLLFYALQHQYLTLPC